VRLDHHRPLAPAERRAPDPDAPLVLERQAQRLQRVGGQIAFGIDVADAVEIERVDLALRHELLNVEDVGRAAGDALELVFGEDHMCPAIDAHTLGERVRGHDVTGFRIDELLRHRVAGTGVDVV
jgi:hypothetical protein